MENCTNRNLEPPFLFDFVSAHSRRFTYLLQMDIVRQAALSSEIWNIRSAQQLWDIWADDTYLWWIFQQLSIMRIWLCFFGVFITTVCTTWYEIWTEVGGENCGNRQGTRHVLPINIWNLSSVFSCYGVFQCQILTPTIRAPCLRALGPMVGIGVESATDCSFDPTFLSAYIAPCSLIVQLGRRQTDWATSIADYAMAYRRRPKSKVAFRVPPKPINRRHGKFSKCWRSTKLPFFTGPVHFNLGLIISPF